MRGFREIFNFFNTYIIDKTATIVVVFAIMAPVLIGISGMSLDYSQAYLVRQRLENALDAAALAGAASSTDAAEIEQRVKDFFAANYPESKLGIVFEPVVIVTGDEVRVTGTAQYETMFLSVLGIDTIDVSASTTVLREVQGIEAVMVLDNTGSMSTNDNIGALRNAASNFIYIMYGIDLAEGAAADPAALDGMATRDRDFIKIGLVPYSTSVNVGPYGLGKDTSGDYYSDVFVNNPKNIPYTTSSSDNNWMGCILEGDYPDDTIDHEGPWDMYRYCRNANDAPYCDLNKKGQVNQKPNYICPKTPIMPLSNSPSDLKYSINTMAANGSTLGNVGMVWGYRVISPDFPFEEAVGWDNKYWRKAVIMMTDGENVMNDKYSAYGPTQDHSIDAGDLNDRFAEVCENMKEAGLIIYTITFYSGVPESTKDYYRECATSENYYYDAPNQEDLIGVFEKIARELSNLHIKE